MNQRKRVWIGVGVLFSLVLCLVFCSMVLAAQQTAEDLYQAGLLKKEGDGDLEAAIEIFQKIVRDFSGERAVASKALLQIGICHEKLGQKEAESAFCRIIDEYPEQSETVKTARQKLAALTTSKAEPGIEPVKAPEGIILRELDFPQGVPSPDGKYIAYESDNLANIMIYEISTSEKTQLTDFEPKRLQWCDSPKWSSDGTRVAFGRKTDEEIDELHIISLKDRERKVIFSDPEREVFELAGWSPDDRKIFVVLRYKNYTYSLASIDVGDGSLDEFENLDRTYVSFTDISPDGRYMAYDFREPDDLNYWDIKAAATDGSGSHILVEHAAYDQNIGWTPDGSAFLFVSSRGGDNGIWLLHIEDGKPAGEPRLVQTMVGSIWPYGITADGDLYFSQDTDSRDVYTAQIDLATGHVIESPENVETVFKGHSSTSFWSPDGKYLGYLFRQNQGWSMYEYNIMRIRSIESGDTREFLLDFRPSIFSQLPRWSPGGASIFFTGSKKNIYGLYRFDLESGKSSLVSDEKNLVSFSPDASVIIRSERERTTTMTEWQARIFRKSLETGEEKEIYQSQKGTTPLIMTISPEKKWFGFGIRNHSPDDSYSSLNVLPLFGGVPVELLRSESEESYIGAEIFWGPPGKGILFEKRYAAEEGGGPGPSELWYIPELREGVQPRKLDLEMRRISQLSFHPDGKTITFTSGGGISKSKFWILENYQSNKD